MLQVSEVITDSLSLHLRPEKSVLPSGAFAFLEEKPNIVTIPPMIKRAIEKKQSGPALFIDKKIKLLRILAL